LEEDGEDVTGFIFTIEGALVAVDFFVSVLEENFEVVVVLLGEDFGHDFVDFDIFEVFETRKEHFNKFHHCFPLLIPEFRKVPFRWIKRVVAFLVEQLEKCLKSLVKIIFKVLFEFPKLHRPKLTKTFLSLTDDL
jgi:hypothetical protein